MRLGWKDPMDCTKDPSIEDAAETARKAEVAVVCIGNTATQEGEGADVAGFSLSGRQEELLAKVLDANPNTIVVVYGGVPVRMKSWLSRARAVVAALYPGEEGGTALASLVLGEKNFSGKLPFSYIQEPSECPGFAGYKDPSLNVPYSEGVFTGYRWYDSHGINPLFPFGFGLSFTSFSYSDLSVQQDPQGRHEVLLRVTNTGARDGDEVVQIYVEPRQSQLPRPVRELKGFGRVSLKAGESKALRIVLDERAFSYYNPAKQSWGTDPGQYVVYAAASSRDLRMEKTVTVK
jgi:beta-glucosidase